MSSEKNNTTVVGVDVEVSPYRPPKGEGPSYLPIYILTAVFGALFLIGPLLVRRGPNASVTRCCIMISAFCCWIFWLTTYIVQMNPLLGPRLSNITLAWIGHKWGTNPKELPIPEETLKLTPVDKI